MVKLSDGSEINFDWHAISQKEWRLLLDVKTDYETNDIIVGKLIGLEPCELEDMNPLDYRAIAQGMWDDFREQANLETVKNLEGASSPQS
jgi:hypothetical protein